MGIELMSALELINDLANLYSCNSMSNRNIRIMVHVIPHIIVINILIFIKNYIKYYI